MKIHKEQTVIRGNAPFSYAADGLSPRGIIAILTEFVPHMRFDFLQAFSAGFRHHRRDKQQRTHVNHREDEESLTPGKRQHWREA